MSTIPDMSVILTRVVAKKMEICARKVEYTKFKRTDTNNTMFRIAQSTAAFLSSFWRLEI